MVPLVDRVTFTIRIPLGAGVNGVEPERELECAGFYMQPFESPLRHYGRVLIVFNNQLCQPALDSTSTLSLSTFTVKRRCLAW
jgi:hypothetical protein